MFLLSLNPPKLELTTSCKAMKVEGGSSSSRTEIWAAVATGGYLCLRADLRDLYGSMGPGSS